MKNLKVLIVDDEKLIREGIKKFLIRYDFQAFEAGNKQETFEILNKYNIDLLILDIKLPGCNGLELLKLIKKDFPKIEVIMISGHSDVDNVLESFRLGAFDFFKKPLSLLDIHGAIKRTSNYLKLKNQVKDYHDKFEYLQKSIDSNFPIIGQSKQIKEVSKLIKLASESEDTPVLITGPSGTGKELIAKAIHYSSPNRKKNLFYPLNTSAIPENLIESEMFGHKRGSFTGALEDKAGCFEASHNGSLFLDEIGDMPYSFQTKLLRVLEESKIKRIGENSEINVNVRIISATNKNIADLIKDKKFRLDLFYRINTLEIFLPPLKERKEDIPLLFDYYVNYYSKKLNKPISFIDDKIINCLMDYDYPGNIRELKNMIERALIICIDNKLSLKNFIFRNLKNSNNISQSNNEENEILDLIEIEKEKIVKAKKLCNNNKSKMARVLNISRHKLLLKMKKYEIN
jgi:DNA-binding NtrC family response regulator